MAINVDVSIFFSSFLLCTAIYACEDQALVLEKLGRRSRQ